MTEISYRKAEEKDVDALTELDALCFSSPWSRQSFYEDIVKNPLAFYLIAEKEGVIVGYAGLWKIVGEGHITNVAVRPENRRQHIGEGVLQILFKICEKEFEIQSFTLEVRASNEGALRLYEKFGFRQAGRRKAYYEDNGEDALIMWR